MFTRIKTWFHELVVDETAKAIEVLQLKATLHAEAIRVAHVIEKFADELRDKLLQDIEAVKAETVTDLKNTIESELGTFKEKIKNADALVKEAPSTWKADAELVAADHALRKAK